MQSRGDCLAAIEAGWPDIAPASLTGPGEMTWRRAAAGLFVHELVAEQVSHAARCGRRHWA